MKTITVMDTTLCREDSSFSFKEKMEIVRQLERLNVDVMELPEIENAKRDVLFVRTASTFVKHAVISVAAGSNQESIDRAAAALSAAAHGRIRIELPVSPVGMEYTCHKKPDKMKEWIAVAVSAAKTHCADVEFCAVDATRAESDFLKEALVAAVQAGASSVAVCDSTGEWMPDDFAAFVAALVKEVNVPLAVRCNDKNGLAAAQAILAVRGGATGVKVSVGGSDASLETIAMIVKNCGNSYGIESNIRQTQLHSTVKQLKWITDNVKNGHACVTGNVADEIGIHLDANDDVAAVSAAVLQLGYDLSEEDAARVYEEFCRVAQKKTVTAKELEAIVASTALQVPAAYKLVNYVVNSGNIITSSAQITLEHDGETMQGVSIGDGPIDAAFLAIDNILGHHYELDDFQIQSVTQGKEAIGSAIVKLRANGKLYAGNGISTDIIGASIRAYLNAVNKIVYEEA